MPADIVAGDTFARLRIGYDIEGTQSPTASIAGGETEDYAITIAAGENQPPVAEDVSVDADEARPVTVEITATDPDHDADDLTYTVGTGPADGSVDGDGPEFTYTSNARFSGTGSFTVEVCDRATASINVAAFAPPRGATRRCR